MDAKWIFCNMVGVLGSTLILLIVMNLDFELLEGCGEKSE